MIPAPAPAAAYRLHTPEKTLYSLITPPGGLFTMRRQCLTIIQDPGIRPTAHAIQRRVSCTLTELQANVAKKLPADISHFNRISCTRAQLVRLLLYRLRGSIKRIYPQAACRHGRTSFAAWPLRARSSGKDASAAREVHAQRLEEVLRCREGVLDHDLEISALNAEYKEIIQ